MAILRVSYVLSISIYLFIFTSGNLSPINNLLHSGRVELSETAVRMLDATNKKILQGGRSGAKSSVVQVFVHG